MNKLIVGVKRHPKRFFVALIFGYTTLWSVLEPAFAVLDVKTANHRLLYILGYFILSLIISIYSVWPKKFVEFQLLNTNTKVSIQFGNLFDAKGHKVIPVNEYFDSLIGRPVAPTSVHGRFIESILGGHSHILDNAVDAQLASQEIELLARPEGKHKKYLIGSTITIPHHESLYFLFALCNSDNDCKASCNPSLMLKAMEGLWARVRIDGNGNDINVPLIGNGLSGIGLPPSQLVQLILISLLKFTKEKDLNCLVRIILLRETFDSIDLELIKHNWQ